MVCMLKQMRLNDYVCIIQYEVIKKTCHINLKVMLLTMPKLKLGDVMQMSSFQGAFSLIV